MRNIFLLAALAGLCGCSHVDRTPIVPMDSTPPMSDSANAAPETKVTPLPANPPPAYVDSVPHDGGGGVDMTGRRWGSESEAISAVNGQMEDIYFPYDQSDPSGQATAALGRDAALLREILREFPQLQVTVEGHCDERGSAEYNIGLGDRRASRTIAALAQLGLPAASFSPVSYGKEAPQCTESNESCWSRNRRAHFVVRSRPTE
ncbi:MAG TPA: OmpA family protein [Bryobacteraceae bacterium]|nr:OmpA family protein [Bryobacteraceae bacterium]